MKKKKSLHVRYKNLFSRYTVMFGGYLVLTQFIVYLTLMLIDESYVWFALLGVFILSIAGLVVLTQSLAKSTNTTIKKLLTATQAAALGEKRELISLERQDEFVALADSINTLVDRDKAIRDANEDPLTGLVNRRYLTQRLEYTVSKKKIMSLLFIDLDGFKPINDEYGHDVGDEALKIASERMVGCVRDSDIVSRIGGDEFIILFNGLDDREIIKQKANRVLEAIAETMWISGNRIKMGASIGISIFPEDGNDAEEIMNAADEAMYSAKQGGKNAFKFYS